MPYTKKADRKRVENSLVRNVGSGALTVGDLTFALYRICLDYWKQGGRYQTIAEIRGALVGVLDELNRRHFHPYEDSKVIENGDVV